DELGLADDPVERRVLGGEAEVGVEAEPLRLEARRALRGGLLHRVPDAAVEVADELVEDGLLRVEVEVEGAGRDAGGLGDLDDRRIVEAELAEDALGGVEQAPARVEAPLRERPPVDVRQHDIRHAVTFNSDLTIFPIEFRGSSSTRWKLFGTLKRARWRRQCSRSSSSATGSARTTKATQTSPHRSSGTPTTATSATAGCSCSTASISAG